MSREVCVSSWHQGRAQLELGSHSGDSQEWSCIEGERVPSELTYLKLPICSIEIKPQMQWNGLTLFRDITYGSHLQGPFHLTGRKRRVRKYAMSYTAIQL